MSAKTNTSTIRQLRKQVKELADKLGVVESTLAYVRQRESNYINSVNEQKKIREQKNVTDLTNGLAVFIGTITGRRVKNINWSWE